MTPTEFRDAVADALSVQLPAEWTVQPRAELSLRLAHKERGAMLLRLGSRYERYKRASGAKAASAVADAAAMVVQRVNLESESTYEELGNWANVASRILPRFIRDDERVPHLGTRRVHRSWSRGLSIGYGIDFPELYIGVTERMMEGWGMDEPRLFEVAMRNLSGVATDPSEGIPGHLYSFHTGENPSLNSVQVLLPEQMRRISALLHSNELVVAVPNQTFSLVASPISAEPLRLAASREYRRQPNPLSPNVHWWRDGQWVGHNGR